VASSRRLLGPPLLPTISSLRIPLFNSRCLSLRCFDCARHRTWRCSDPIPESAVFPSAYFCAVCVCIAHATPSSVCLAASSCLCLLLAAKHVKRQWPSSESGLWLAGPLSAFTALMCRYIEPPPSICRLTDGTSCETKWELQGMDRDSFSSTRSVPAHVRQPNFGPHYHQSPLIHTPAGRSCSATRSTRPPPCCCWSCAR